MPVYVDDGSPWAAPQDWPEATATKGSRIAGVDYDGLNRTLSKYFEDPTLVNSAHTKAIVVIYQARPGLLLYLSLFASHCVPMQIRLAGPAAEFPAPGPMGSFGASGIS